jgi:hypothetical protein
VSGFEGGNCLAAETFLAVEPSDGEGYEDLRGLKISTSRRNPNELIDFFPLPTASPPVQKSRLLIAVGLPSQNSGVDYEPTHVQGRTITIPCDYMAASTKVRGFHSVRLKAIPEMGAWPVDGLSGGARSFR